MRRRLYSRIVVIFAGLAISGCVQATRHSNTMLFGTSTQFGIRAGSTPANIPEVNIGYARQEAVVMPLVANSQDNGTNQTPCDPSKPLDNGSARYAVHPCMLVGINGSAQDSYSVLASFGAKFNGTAQGTGPNAQGGLAQYFATGMAAQLLALNGGAAVVSVGEAAAESAKTSKATPAAVSALFGNDATFARGVAQRDTYRAFRSRLLAKVELTGADAIKDRITAFEQAAGVSNRGVAEDCTSVELCKKALTDNDAYREIYGSRSQQFEQALAAWKVD